MRFAALAASVGLHALAVALAPSGAKVELPKPPPVLLDFVQVATPPPPAPVIEPPRVAPKAPRGPKRVAAPQPAPPAAALPDQGGALPVPEAPVPFVFKAKFSEEKKQEELPGEAGPASAPVEVGASLEREVKARYPDEALAAGVDGIVELRLIVGADGSVEEAKVISAPGYGMAEAARQAVLRARFKPATRDGLPVRSTIKYRYVFELD